MTEYINVVLLEMENGIHEQVTKNHDNGFTVFLNSRDSYEMRRQSYVHAVEEHIQNNDHEKHDIQEIEVAAHK